MKSGKGIQGPAPEHEKDTKMEPQGAKMEPKSMQQTIKNQQCQNKYRHISLKSLKIMFL